MPKIKEYAHEKRARIVDGDQKIIKVASQFKIPRRSLYSIISNYRDCEELKKKPLDRNTEKIIGT